MSSTLDDFFGSSDEATPECLFCDRTDGELVVSVQDANGATHWHHEKCNAEHEVDKEAGVITPTWDEAMDACENDVTSGHLCLKEDSKGNWQPLFSLTKQLKKITDRSPSGLVATCEICGKRGGSTIIPYKAEYWPVEQSGKGGDIAYRCKAHGNS